MADVELKSISKEYDLKTMGLTNVSLTFPDGSLTTLAGAAGCGKSTLLFCICGLVDITSGELYIGGKRADGLLPKERDVCLTREGQPACRGDVFDNISYGLRLRGLPKAEIKRRASEAAEVVGLADKLNVNVRKLTESDRRRVAIARCVARRAAVSLIDEPLFNIPEEDRLPLAECIKRARAASGSTFIVATSCGADAFLFGGGVAVMRDGSVVAEGDERSLTETPPDMFAASFLGEDQMSFFNADGKTLGVRRGGLEPSEDGELDAEVIGGASGELLVRPDPNSPALTVASDKIYPAGTIIKLKIVKAAEFDGEGKFISKYNKLIKKQ